MSEIRFQIQWLTVPRKPAIPLFVKDYFTPNSDYDLDNFVPKHPKLRAIAFRQSMADLVVSLGQLQEIEIKSAHYSHLCQPKCDSFSSLNKSN